MGFLNSYAAIGWSSTGDTAPSRVVMLGVPLRQTHPGFSQATYRAQSLDRSTIESLVIPNGAHELVGEIRYQQDSQGLLDMLVAGSANKTLTYYPDVRDPSQSYACKLIEPVGPQIDTAMDPQRNTFGDSTVAVRLRRTDAGPFTEQYVGTNLLFWYKGGGSLQGFTFTRATVATQLNAGGVYATQSSGKAATSWYDTDADRVPDTPAFVLSPARTNLCLQSENFGTTWSAANSPTRVAAAKTCGTVSLDLIGDDSAAALEGYTQTVTFTGNAVKSISIHLAQGSSTSTVVRLLDTTATANRLRAVVTWTAGVPTSTPNEGVFLGALPRGNGVWRLYFQTTSVTAANTNSLEVYPATDAALAVTGTGTVYAGGVQAENALYPGEYVPTTTGTVTRNEEVATVPFNAKPQAMTLYLRFIDLGSLKNTATVETLLSVGGGSGARLRLSSNGTFYNFLKVNAAGAAIDSAAATATALGDVVELVGVLAANGSVQLIQSINGTTTTAAASVAQALDPAWNSAVLAFGLTGFNATAGLLNAVGMRGVQSLDTMRRVARV